MRWLALLIPFLVVLGCENPKPTQKATARKSPERHPAGPQEYVPPKPKLNEQPKSRDEQFNTAWAEANKLAAAADKTEPELTERALKLLTRGEHVAASNAMFRPDHYLDRGAADLKRLGLSAWLECQSRKKAQADPSFKGVANKVWEPTSGAQGIFSMMNVWGEIPPEVLRGTLLRIGADSSADRMTAEERDAVLKLGGAKWLSERR